MQILQKKKATFIINDIEISFNDESDCDDYNNDSHCRTFRQFHFDSEMPFLGVIYMVQESKQSKPTRIT